MVSAASRIRRTGTSIRPAIHHASTALTTMPPALAQRM